MTAHPARPVRLAIAGLLAVSLASSADAITYTWIAPGDGDWSVADNWSPPGPPDASDADVIIDGDVSVTLDTDRVVRNLTIGFASELLFGENADLVVTGASLDTDGLFDQGFASSGSNDVLVASPLLTVGPPVSDGAWSMSGDNVAVIRASSPGNTIVLEQSLHGSGNVGAGTHLGILNASDIVATGGEGVLTIQPGNSADAEADFDFVNSGTGKVFADESGAKIELRDGWFLNNGRFGTDEFSGQSRIHIVNAQVDNGPTSDIWWPTFEGDVVVRGGRLKGDGQGASGSDVVLADLEMPDYFVTFGTLTMEGLLTFDEASVAQFPPNATARVADGVVRWAGPGTVDLMTVLENADTSPAVLDISSAMTLRGNEGQLGNNDDLGVVNDGAVESDQLGCGTHSFVIDTGVNANVDGDADFLNRGVLSAENFVPVFLRNLDFMNDGGTVQATPNANVVFESTTDVLNQTGAGLEGGTWRAVSTITQPSFIEMPGTPITTIRENTTVELEGPFAEIRIGGQSITSTLLGNRGTLILTGDANFVASNDFVNEQLLNLGVGADVLAFSSSSDFAQRDTGVLVVEAAGTGGEDYGQISFAGFAFLDGELRMDTAPGFDFVAGQMFTVIEATRGIDGTFASVVFPPGVTGTIDYGADDVVVMIDAVTAIDDGLPGDGVELPVMSSAVRARPNPFNPSTSLQFSLERPEAVQLDVFDARGARVRRVAEGTFAPGRHEVRFDGTDDHGRALGSGVYYVRMVTPSVREVEKITLLK